MDFIPYKRWLHLYDEHIKAEFPDRPTAVLAEECDVNYYTVSRRATRLGVSKSPVFMHSSWKKGSNKKGGWKIAGERAKNIEAVDAYMQEHFANTKNETLAEHFGVDVKTVRRWARRLGLMKSNEFMFALRSSGKKGKNFYTDEQKAWRNQRIAEVFPDADDEELCRLADELGLGLHALRCLACKAGIRRSPEQRKNSLKRIAKANTKYGPDVIEALRAYFPDHTDAECAARFGISEGVIGQLAHRYGMRKTKEHRSRVVRESNHKRHENNLKH